MKLELWEQDMIEFMGRASEYSDYNRRLTEKMLPWLHGDTHICDAGSGLGYLSLALSPHVGRVTAVERNPDAAAVLTENCRRLGISNVISRCSAIAEVPPETPYDAMVFCFFGGIREILMLAKTQCRGDVFVFTRNYDTHASPPAPTPRNIADIPSLQMRSTSWASLSTRRPLRWNSDSHSGIWRRLVGSSCSTARIRTRRC